MTSEAPDSPSPTPEPLPGESLLDTLGRRLGHRPSLSLIDEGGTDGANVTPIVDPRVSDIQDQLRSEDRGKYQVLGEIARGGMGVVLRGHDRELGRDVAMKVVHSNLAGREEVIARFVEEAQIGGQLQHPGIVPVYELGLMEDQRPYFTMKLIKGRTLAKMLSRRKSVEEDRVRFLSIFESVCQTMAYAHSKGVIHRDLKPANVMVGGFGEVQVVDWGLSKVLGSGGVADELAARQEAQTIISTVRSGPGSDSGSLVGNVLGTPEYMAPEQAQGDIKQLDERTDVFALGAILCELLTGAPPYVADSSSKLVQLAAAAELDDAYARIEAASASEALKKLCLACLRPAKQARPSSAEEIAQAVHDHIGGLESAVHEERLRAERSRRRLQLTLSTALLLAVAGGGWWWVDGQRRARSAELLATFNDVQAEALQSTREGNFVQALEAARGGLRLVETGAASSGLRKQAQKLVATAEKALGQEQDRLAGVERERRLLDALTDIEMRLISRTGTELYEELDALFVEALEEYGLDPKAEDFAERMLELRDSPVGIQLALGLDGWSRLLRRSDRERQVEIDLFTAIGIDLDPDPLRRDIRLALVEGEEAPLLALAEDIDVKNTPSETLALLASSLKEWKHPGPARALFVRGANQYTDSFLLNYGAADSLYDIDDIAPERAFEGALAYGRTALALRPDLTGPRARLGDIYFEQGSYVLAYQCLKQAVEMVSDPSRWNPSTLGWMYLRAGDREGAIPWFERDLASSFPGPWTARFLKANDLAQGRLSMEEFVASGQASESDIEDLIVVAVTCTMPGFLGVEPQPDRVVDLLAPYLPEGPLREGERYWTQLAWASIALGDSATATLAHERALELDENPVNKVDRSMQMLREACVLRLQGDARGADRELEKARWERIQLMAGMEDEWRATGFYRNFEHYEPFAISR